MDRGELADVHVIANSHLKTAEPTFGLLNCHVDTIATRSHVEVLPDTASGGPAQTQCSAR